MVIGAATIWLFLAVLTAVVASSKGRSAFGWFLLGCLFGIFALIIVAVLPNLTKREVQKVRRETKKLQESVSKEAARERAEPSQTEVKQLALEGAHKKCPDCAEAVKLEARICRFCGYEFMSKEELEEHLKEEQARGVVQLAERLGVSQDRAEELLEFLETVPLTRRSALAKESLGFAGKILKENRPRALAYMEQAYLLADGDAYWQGQILKDLKGYRKS